MKRMKRRILALSLSFALVVGSFSGMGNVISARADETTTDGSIPIDEAHFPDEEFRTYLLGNLEDHGNDIDQNRDGKLSEEERKNVGYIGLYGRPVKSLKGIEYFPNLNNLTMEKALLTEADLSQNTALQRVNLSMNTRLSSINLSGCSEMTELNLDSCALTELDLASCTELTSLYAWNNKLTSLALDANTKLISLNVSGNSLKSVDVSKLPELMSLDCNNNALSVLDLSACTKLDSVHCSYNQLSSLDLTKLPELQSLYCDNNVITELDVSQNTKLNNLYAQGNQLTELNISQNTKLNNLEINGNQITSLDASKNKVLYGNDYTPCWTTSDISGVVKEAEDGSWFLDLSGQKGFNKNKLTVVNWGDGDNYPEITDKGVSWKKNPVNGNWTYLDMDYDLSNNFYLDGQVLRCRYRLTSATVEYNTKFVEITEANFPDANFRKALQESYDGDGDGRFQPGTIENLYVGEKQIKDLTGIEYFTYLTELFCHSNELTELNLSKNTGLVRLHCDNNALTALDVSKSAGLTYLYCYNNKLTELDLSKNTVLQELNCDNNKLSKLDVSNNTALNSLSFGMNQVTEIDVTKNTELTHFAAYNNSILNFDLSKNKKLGSILVWGQRITVDVVKGEDGNYTANSPVLSSLSEKELQNDPILNKAKKTGDGLWWNENPMSGLYVQTIYLNREFELGNPDYISGTTFDVQLELRNTYEEFNMEEITIDEAHFPDKAFRNYLTENFDTDRDGKFQPGLISRMDFHFNEQVRDVTGIEYFSSLTYLSLCQDKNITKVDLSRNTNLETLNIDGTQIHSLDLRNSTKMREIMGLWSAPLVALYLAEDCMENTGLGDSRATATAKEENGRYVLDLSEYGGFDTNRIMELSDGDVEGDKIYWDTETDIPVTLSYKFLVREDYEEGQEYTDRDYLSVHISLTNNAPPVPEGKKYALTAENFPSSQLLETLRNYDYDNDGMINTSEIVWLSFYDAVTSLDGIEKLNCLQSLWIWNGGSLTSLNLTDNTVLTDVTVTNNSLTKVDLSNCPYLENLNLSNNSLSQINLEANRALRTLDLSGNSLTEIDVSKNTALKSLNVRNNAISALDLQNNTKLQVLDCNDNRRITTLDLSVLRKLKELYIRGNQISSFSAAAIPNLTVLDIDSNSGHLSELDLTANTRLKSLNASDLSIKANWPEMTALEFVDITDHSLQNLDLSNAQKLKWFCVTSQNLTELDLHGCGVLKDVNVWVSQLEKIKLSGCTALTTLYCSNGKLEELDVSDCVSLKTLECGNNMLQSLDVTKNEALQSLNCENNKLATVDTSHNPALKYFQCSNNPIVSLDLSENKAMLTDLLCFNGSLTSLDVEESEVLENVDLGTQIFDVSADDLTAESELTESDSNADSENQGQTDAGQEAGDADISESAPIATPQVALVPLVLTKRWTLKKEPAQASDKYYLNLDKYGSFNPAKVKNLVGGQVTEHGIMWDSIDDIPTSVTYDYDISNNYKLSNRQMSVNIRISNKLKSELVGEDNPETTEDPANTTKPDTTDTPANPDSTGSVGNTTQGTSNVDSSGSANKKTVKKTMKLSKVKAKKGSKKITGTVSVKNAVVKVKVGKKKFKKAKVKGKKFTFKCAKLKKGTKVKIKVTKKNYKTLTKTVKVK